MTKGKVSRLYNYALKLPLFVFVTTLEESAYRIYNNKNNLAHTSMRLVAGANISSDGSLLHGQVGFLAIFNVYIIRYLNLNYI